MGGRLHRLGRHDGGCVVWCEVVGEGCKTVLSRVGGGVWCKSRGVCSGVGKCWEGHGVGEWQAGFSGDFCLMLPSVSNC